MNWLYGISDSIADFVVAVFATFISGLLTVAVIGAVVFAIMAIANWIKSAPT